MARLNGAVMKSAVPSVCSSPRVGFSPSVSTKRRRPSPPRRRQACPASARRQPQNRAQGSEGFSRQAQGASSAFAEQAGSRDPDAAAAIRRHASRTSSPRPVGSRIPCEASSAVSSRRSSSFPSSRTSARTACAAITSRQRIRQGVSHGAVIGPSPASPEAARAIIGPVRARTESLCHGTGPLPARLLPWRAGRAMARSVGQRTAPPWKPRVPHPRRGLWNSGAGVRRPRRQDAAASAQSRSEANGARPKAREAGSAKAQSSSGNGTAKRTRCSCSTRASPGAAKPIRA